MNDKTMPNAAHIRVKMPIITKVTALYMFPRSVHTLKLRASKILIYTKNALIA